MKRAQSSGQSPTSGTAKSASEAGERLALLLARDMSDRLCGLEDFLHICELAAIGVAVSKDESDADASDSLSTHLLLQHLFLDARNALSASQGLLESAKAIALTFAPEYAAHLKKWDERVRSIEAAEAAGA
jgi:hypothetical protein